MKRFWAEAAAAPTQAGWSVVLDGRPARTPLKAPLVVPTEALARAIAAEWAVQPDSLDPAAMPLTRSVNTALDKVAPDPAARAADLAAAVQGELLCYRADGPVALVAEQARRWDPVLAWAEARLDARFVVTQGLMPVRQPEDSAAAVQAFAGGLDVFALTGLLQAATLTQSVCLGLALLDGQLTPDEAHALAHLDEAFQSSRWGEDPEAAAALTARAQDLKAVAQFLTLARDKGRGA